MKNGDSQIASTPRLGDIVEPRGDPGQVADAVAVGVGEAARIDLVDGGAAPPGCDERGVRSAAAVFSASIAHRIAERRKLDFDAARRLARSAGSAGERVEARFERVSTRTFGASGSVEVLKRSSISRPVPGSNRETANSPGLSTNSGPAAVRA